MVTKSVKHQTNKSELVRLHDALALHYLESDLYDALRTYQERYGCELPPLSEAFRRRMAALTRRRDLLDRARRLTSRAAAVILAILVTGATLLLVNEEVRADVIRYFQKFFETHTEYHFNNTAMEWEGEFRLYEPGWVPEGYVERFRRQSKDGLMVRYDKKTGENVEEIYFSCDNERTAGISLNTENTTRYLVEYAGEEAEYYESYDPDYQSSFVWGNKYGGCLILSGNLTLEEFVEMADSTDVTELVLECPWIEEAPEGYELISASEEWGRNDTGIYNYMSVDMKSTFVLTTNDEILLELVEEHEKNRKQEILWYDDVQIVYYLPTDFDERCIYVWRNRRGCVFILNGQLEYDKVCKLVSEVKMK